VAALSEKVFEQCFVARCGRHTWYAMAHRYIGLLVVVVVTVSHDLTGDRTGERPA
jgi:hypothetical protein